MSVVLSHSDGLLNELPKALFLFHMSRDVLSYTQHLHDLVFMLFKFRLCFSVRVRVRVRVRVGLRLRA